MRPALLLLVLLPSAVFAACVGDSPATTPGADASPDVTTTNDAASDAPIVTDAAPPSDASDASTTLPSVGGLKIWFRADVTLKKDAVGVTWPDQGPFSLDAVAGVDAGSAGYPNPKQNFFPNNMPAVEFATDPQLLRMPSAPQFDDLTNGVTFLIAAIPTASKAGQWISFGASSSGARVTFGQNGSVMQVALGATVYAASGPNGQVPVNQHHVFVATVKGSGGADSIAFYRDGQAAGTATGTSLANVARQLETIGGGQSGSTVTTSPIGFGEILVYGKVLTPGERSSIEAYLKARWGTP